jgi:hypothetical protein
MSKIHFTSKKDMDKDQVNNYNAFHQFRTSVRYISSKYHGKSNTNYIIIRKVEIFNLKNRKSNICKWK